MVIGGDVIFGSTTLTGAVYSSSLTGGCLFKEGKFCKERAMTIGGTSLATGATTTTLTSYSLTIQSKHKNATAYIESLNDSELAALEVMLENKDLDIDENLNQLNSPKQLIKKL